MKRVTAEQKRAEQLVAKTVEQAFGVKFHRYPELYQVGWWVEKDSRLVGVAEIKTRSCTHDRYPTVYLALHKWLSLQMSALTGIHAHLFVKWKDKLGMIEVCDIPVSKLSVGGRTDREDLELEPMVEIPIADMEMLE